MNESDNLNRSDLMHRVPEGLMSTDVGRRENMGIDEFARIQRNEATSHSLLGNLSGTDHKKGRGFKENSTVSINLKKHNLNNGYEQSLSNMIKYDTTAVISEEYSNFEDPFTQMYTNSILSVTKGDRNIEEMHYLQVQLFKNIKKVLEKSEYPAQKNSIIKKNKKKDPQPDPENILELCSEESLD